MPSNGNSLRSHALPTVRRFKGEFNIEDVVARTAASADPQIFSREHTNTSWQIYAFCYVVINMCVALPYVVFAPCRAPSVCLGALLLLLCSPAAILYPCVQLVSALFWKTKSGEARLERALPPSPWVPFGV